MGSILLVLSLSANTGLRRLSEALPCHRAEQLFAAYFWFPRRRLVYTYGILVLAVLTALLLILFGGITDKLIPLYGRRRISSVHAFSVRHGCSLAEKARPAFG